jgi:hypothetical protein
MALQLRLTGETFKITSDPTSRVVLPPPVTTDALLATESGEMILTDDGASLAVESSHGN